MYRKKEKKEIDKTIYLERMLSSYTVVYQLISFEKFTIVSPATFVCHLRLYTLCK